MISGDWSLFDAGTLGGLGVLPDWPGDDVHPPQPMEAQIRAMLAAYAERGGAAVEREVADSSHGPFIDHLDECADRIWGFVSGR